MEFCLINFEDPVILQPSINLAFMIARKKQGKRPYLKDYIISIFLLTDASKEYIVEINASTKKRLRFNRPLQVVTQYPAMW